MTSHHTSLLQPGQTSPDPPAPSDPNRRTPAITTPAPTPRTPAVNITTLPTPPPLIPAAAGIVPRRIEAVLCGDPCPRDLVLPPSLGVLAALGFGRGLLLAVPPFLFHLRREGRRARASNRLPQRGKPTVSLGRTARLQPQLLRSVGFGRFMDGDVMSASSKPASGGRYDMRRGDGGGGRGGGGGGSTFAACHEEQRMK